VAGGALVSDSLVHDLQSALEGSKYRAPVDWSTPLGCVEHFDPPLKYALRVTEPTEPLVVGYQPAIRPVSLEAIGDILFIEVDSRLDVAVSLERQGVEVSPCLEINEVAIEVLRVRCLASHMWRKCRTPLHCRVRILVPH
jgi:hypothetical protein